MQTNIHIYVGVIESSGYSARSGIARSNGKCACSHISHQKGCNRFYSHQQSVRIVSPQHSNRIWCHCLVFADLIYKKWYLNNFLICISVTVRLNSFHMLQDHFISFFCQLSIHDFSHFSITLLSFVPQLLRNILQEFSLCQLSFDLIYRVFNAIKQIIYSCLSNFYCLWILNQV